MSRILLRSIAAHVILSSYKRFSHARTMIKENCEIKSIFKREKAILFIWDFLAGVICLHNIRRHLACVASMRSILGVMIAQYVTTLFSG